MYNTGDIYRIIQDALDANQIYCADSKLGDGSEDTYETDTEFVSGNDAHLIATVKHQHFDYNRPYQENEHTETTKFRNHCKNKMRQGNYYSSRMAETTLWWLQNAI